jgi:hypothetical protein
VRRCGDAARGQDECGVACASRPRPDRTSFALLG